MAEKPQGPPRPRVRATKRKRVGYSRALATRICDRLAQGECWYRIAGKRGMPSYGSLYVWIRRYPDFAEAVAMSREMGADYCADRALVVAEAATKETVQQDRLFVNTLMKRAALAGPRAWGGKAASTPKATKAEPVEVVFYVRHFEKVVGPDGKLVVREIPREDKA